MAGMGVLEGGRVSETLTGKLLFQQVNDTKISRTLKIVLSVLIIPVAIAAILDLGIMFGRLILNGCKSLVGRVYNFFKPKVLTEDEKDIKAIQASAKKFIDALEDVSKKSIQGKECTKSQKELASSQDELGKTLQRFLSREADDSDKLLNRYKAFRYELTNEIQKRARSRSFPNEVGKVSLTTTLLKDKADEILLESFKPIIGPSILEKLKNEDAVSLENIEKGMKEKLFNKDIFQELIPYMFDQELKNGFKSAKRIISQVTTLAVEKNLIESKDSDQLKKLVGKPDVQKLVEATKIDLERNPLSPVQFINEVGDLIDNGYLTNEEMTCYTSALTHLISSDLLAARVEIQQKLSDARSLINEINRDLTDSVQVSSISEKRGTLTVILGAYQSLYGMKEMMLISEDRAKILEGAQSLFQDVERIDQSLQNLIRSSLENEIRSKLDDEINPLIWNLKTKLEEDLEKQELSEGTEALYAQIDQLYVEVDEKLGVNKQLLGEDNDLFKTLADYKECLRGASHDMDEILKIETERENGRRSLITRLSNLIFQKR